MLCARRTSRRAVATSAPAATMKTPTPSTAVPMISMSCRKFSMNTLLAAKRAAFQCCSRGGAWLVYRAADAKIGVYSYFAPCTIDIMTDGQQAELYDYNCYG